MERAEHQARKWLQEQLFWERRLRELQDQFYGSHAATNERPLAIDREEQAA